MLKQLLITLLLSAMTVASAGTMIILEEAAEFDALSVRVSDKGKGTFRLRPCDECKELRLKIAPTTALRVGGKRLPLAAVNSLTLRSGTVFYDVDTRVVTRIEAVR